MRCDLPKNFADRKSVHRGNVGPLVDYGTSVVHLPFLLACEFSIAEAFSVVR